jgi:hypothetical protein
VLWEVIRTTHKPSESRHDRNLTLCVNDPSCWKSTPVLPGYKYEFLHTVTLLVPKDTVREDLLILSRFQVFLRHVCDLSDLSLVCLSSSSYRSTRATTTHSVIFFHTRPITVTLSFLDTRPKTVTGIRCGLIHSLRFSCTFFSELEYGLRRDRTPTDEPIDRSKGVTQPTLT